MPVVHCVAQSQRKDKRQLVDLIFPVRTSSSANVTERWHWPELRAAVSGIQGFGLFPREGGALDWTSLKRPVMMPYLGKETEVESAVQARVLRTVLCGQFDVVHRKDLPSRQGHEWVQDGLYITLMPTRDAQAAGMPAIKEDADVRLLQVPLEPEFNSRTISYVEEGDEQVCYLLYDETRELLHLPPHIFELLARHCEDHHADRNMATHLVQFSRSQVGGGPPLHLLVSAHPLFRHSAFIMGNTNEPPRGPPSTELLELELKVAADDDPLMQRHDLKQSQESLAQFRRFAHEHPEIEERSAFFCTRKLNFDLSEEITVVYGNSYKRTYSTWGHAGVPLRYRVPADTYPEGAWTHWAEWPRRCPGWFNVDMQPINRPAFKRTQSLAPYRKRTQPIARLIGDLPAVVASRRLGLYGDDQERRLAQCTSIYWDPRIPQLDGAPRVPPLSGAGEAEDDEDVASDAGFTPGFTPPTAVHWLGCGYAGSLCPKREDFDPLALGMYAGPRLPPWALLAAQVAAGAPGDSPSSKGGEGGGEEGDGGVADLSVTGMCRSTEFELPAELRSLNKEELYRLALAEESHPRRCEDPDDDEDVPLTELEWSAPWRHPLGTIVWVRMRGFSWWPALVCQPYVNDRDIARQRLAGNLFVKFFGWTKGDAYFTNSPDEALSWEDGLALGLLEKRVVRKSHDRMLQTAKREAIAAIAARAPLGKPPLPPPPWWQVRFAGDLAGYLATEPGEEEG
ncbi:hypothetical protein Ctob_016375, partial [Chrysochromulina tobinii]